MPRLSHTQYLKHREHLRDLWIFSGGAYSLLSVNDQWAIHNFYEPTLELTDDELRQHRKHAVEIDPSLPQRAGRAYAKIKHGNWDKVDYTVMPNGRAISLRVLARPHPDYKMLAKVILEIAKRDVTARHKTKP